MALIELQGVGKTFQAGDVAVTALADVSLSIEKGEFVAVMGPSGSGKSTLLSLIGGLSRPTSGRTIVDGLDLGALSQERLSDFRREYLGFVFQAFHLIPYLTVAENVMLPIAVERGMNGTKRLRAMKVLETVGLSSKAGRLPSQLSGGEQERVAIARALVNEPEIILGDEPTGNLDTRTGNEIMEGLKQLNRAGKTVVMVTHNPDNAALANRLVLIRDGRVVKEGAHCHCS